MLDPRAREIHDDSSRLAPDADRQLGFFTTQRDRVDPPDPRREPLDTLERVAAKGHVRAKRVADLAWLVRQSEVAAADDPVEFAWEPPRRPRFPSRDDFTSGTDDLWPSIRRQQRSKPAGLRSCIVVEERDDLPRCMVDSCVTCSGEPAPLLVFDNADRRKSGSSTSLQPVVVVDDDDHLVRGRRLVFD